MCEEDPTIPKTLSIAFAKCILTESWSIALFSCSLDALRNVRFAPILDHSLMCKRKDAYI